MLFRGFWGSLFAMGKGEWSCLKEVELYVVLGVLVKFVRDGEGEVELFGGSRVNYCSKL